MDPDLLNELQMFSRECYEASQTGEIANIKLLQKYVTKLNSIYRKVGTGQSIADMVKEWLEGGRGRFSTKDVYGDLGFTSRADKKAVDMALRRLADKGVLAPLEEKRGMWRPTVTTLEPINWRSANLQTTINLAWPLELEQYFDLYPTNVAVIAGEKNSGKTAFCLNLAYKNALTSPLPIHYFSSEMMEQELMVRISKFPDPTPFDKVEFWRLDYDAIADTIQPNAINIVDFLEVTDEFWKVASKIRRIWERLEQGIVLICIQKDPESKYGRGRAFSMEKARVYLTMTKSQKMTLEEVKNWKDERSPGLIIPYRFRKDGILERKTPPLKVSNKPLASVSPLCPA